MAAQQPVASGGLPTTDSPADNDTKKFPFPLPPVLTFPSAAGPPTLITQGAEGRLYRSTYLLPTVPCAVKHRPAKPWRHPLLDARLTRHRILSEARILAKCRREGVPVPAVYAADESNGVLMMEWVEGAPVRVGINKWLARRRERRRTRRGAGQKQEVVAESENAQPDSTAQAENADNESKVGDDDNADGTGESNEEMVALLRRMGRAVGGLHKVGIIHGDLTTSNMMLRPWAPGRAPSDAATSGYDDDKTLQQSMDAPKIEEEERILDGEIIIIDFGLASQGSAEEDRAVDLYVLERAFASTHPSAEDMFAVVLEAYRETFKQAPIVLKRLDEVRLRGRKRSMLG